jgi:hypothetical protein
VAVCADQVGTHAQVIERSYHAVRAAPCVGAFNEAKFMIKRKRMIPAPPETYYVDTRGRRELLVGSCAALVKIPEAEIHKEENFRPAGNLPDPGCRSMAPLRAGKEHATAPHEDDNHSTPTGAGGSLRWGRALAL